MAHYYVVHIGDCPEEDMDALVGKFYDYYEKADGDVRLSETFPDVAVSSLKTVGDVKKVGSYAVATVFHAVVAGGIPYWNMLRCIPYGLMDVIYDRLLANYEDDTEVHVFDIHV